MLRLLILLVAASIAVLGLVHDAAGERQFVSEFLSVLCFETNIPFVPMAGVICQRKVAPTIVQPPKLADHLYPTYLRLDIRRPLSAERRLGLALYRDGISSRSSYYQFLSLYKALQIRLPGPSVAAWINQHADDNIASAGRVRDLRAQGVADLASYLYENWQRPPEFQS